MGMFDDISTKLYCPYCGKLQQEHSFQTKSFNRTMSSYDVFEIKGIPYAIYHSCKDCGSWIYLEINSEGVHKLNAQKSTTPKKAGHNTD